MFLSRAGAQVELELVPGASHFWKGATDVAAIIARSIGFLRARASGEATAEPPEAVPG